MDSEDSSLDKPEFPWPQKGDQLFKADTDWWLNAGIDNWNQDFHAYAEGYKRAADIVVEHVTANPRGGRDPIDYLVFPIVFLYRQYIELRLKEIILIGNRLEDREQGFPKHHRIDELWKHARPILERYSAKKDDLDIVEACIAELAKIDPDSDTFRYPVDRQGKKSIEAEQLLINLRHLQKVMERLGSFLSSSSEYLFIQFQQKQEIEDY